MPASPGAITNSALLLLLLLLLVLPGFFELLTQLEVLLGEECLAGCLAAQVEHQTVEHSVIDNRGIEGELLVPVGLGVQALCHALGLGHCLTSSTTLRPEGDAVGRHGREGCQLPTSKTMRAARTWRGRVARRPGVPPPRRLARWPPDRGARRAPLSYSGEPCWSAGRCSGHEGPSGHSLRRGAGYGGGGGGGGEPMGLPCFTPIGAGTGPTPEVVAIPGEMDLRRAWL